jgi:hypothetical protein
MIFVGVCVHDSPNLPYDRVKQFLSTDLEVQVKVKDVYLTGALDRGGMTLNYRLIISMCILIGHFIEINPEGPLIPVQFF